MSIAVFISIYPERAKVEFQPPLFNKWWLPLLEIPSRLTPPLKNPVHATDNNIII